MALLHGQGPVGAPGSTSDIYTTPYPLTPGCRLRDNAGNEYLFCDYTGTVVTGSPVMISDDNTAAAIGTTGRGRFGVSIAGGTSDNAGWVQVYGRARVLYGVSGTSVSEASLVTASTSLTQIFTLQTSLTSPVAIARVTAPSLARELFVLNGVTLASDASVSADMVCTDETSLTSTSITVATISVFLNYPTIQYDFHTS